MVEASKDNTTTSNEADCGISLENLEEELEALQKLKVEGDQEAESDENETQKLQRLFLTFKKKYQQALRELAKRDQVFESSELLQKYQESQEEIASLVLQQQQLKERFLQFKKEKANAISSSAISNSSFNEENQRLREELSRTLSKLESAASAVEELQTEGLSGSKDSDTAAYVFAHNKKLQQALQEKERMLTEAFRMRGILGSAKMELEEKIARFHQENQQMQQEVVGARESLTRAFRESEELRQSYQTLANEKEGVLQRNGQLQKQLEETEQKLMQREGELKTALSDSVSLKEEKEKLQQTHERDLKDKKEQESALSSLSDEMRVVKKELFTKEEQIKEKEEGILEAKQHLAKKMKEASFLNETVEEKTRQIVKLQDDLLQTKAKTVEVQGAFEAQTVQMQKVQDLLTACEEKYFRAHERLQEVDAQNRELKKIEEKHEQLQHLLSNLGNMLGKPIGLAIPPESVSEGTSSTKKKRNQVDVSSSFQKGNGREEDKLGKAVLSDIKSKISSTFSQPDLFEFSPPSPKYKKDLFE